MTDYMRSDDTTELRRGLARVNSAYVVSGVLYHGVSRRMHAHLVYFPGASSMSSTQAAPYTTLATVTQKASAYAAHVHDRDVAATSA